MLVIVNKKRFYTAVTIIALILTAAIVLILIPPVSRAVHPLRYENYITKYSAKYNLDPYLIMGVISAESRFDKDAQSHKDALGLMQIKQDTAQWCIQHFELNADVADIYEPATNILIGCTYIDYLIDIFDGQVDTAIAAYNAGQGNVKNWLADSRYSTDGKTLIEIPFDETREYVKKVRHREEIYRDLY